MLGAVEGGHEREGDGAPVQIEHLVSPNSHRCSVRAISAGERLRPEGEELQGLPERMAARSAASTFAFPASRTRRAFKSAVINAVIERISVRYYLWKSRMIITIDSPKTMRSNRLGQLESAFSDTGGGRIRTRGRHRLFPE